MLRCRGILIKNDARSNKVCVDICAMYNNLRFFSCFFIGFVSSVKQCFLCMIFFSVFRRSISFGCFSFSAFLINREGVGCKR